MTFFNPLHPDEILQGLYIEPLGLIHQNTYDLAQVKIEKDQIKAFA